MSDGMIQMTLIIIGVISAIIAFTAWDNRRLAKERDLWLREMTLMNERQFEKTVKEGNERLERILREIGVKTYQIFERVDERNEGNSKT